MIKMKSKSGATIWFNVMNIFSVAEDSKGTLIRTTTNQVTVVQEDLDTVVRAIEKQLIFLSGGGQ